MPDEIWPTTRRTPQPRSIAANWRRCSGEGWLESRRPRSSRSRIRTTARRLTLGNCSRTPDDQREKQETAMLHSLSSFSTGLLVGERSLLRPFTSDAVLLSWPNQPAERNYLGFRINLGSPMRLSLRRGRLLLSRTNCIRLFLYVARSLGEECFHCSFCFRAVPGNDALKNSAMQWQRQPVQVCVAARKAKAASQCRFDESTKWTHKGIVGRFENSHVKTQIGVDRRRKVPSRSFHPLQTDTNVL